MLEPWLELDGARERVAAWSEATGLDLLRLGTTADAEEIMDTTVTVSYTHLTLPTNREV